MTSLERIADIIEEMDDNHGPSVELMILVDLAERMTPMYDYESQQWVTWNRIDGIVKS